ncbi:hypothetical protein SAMN04489867_2440 [Pedococcus dokdonensis]|uniref:Uncharacterized protein n=1 Tax=Pedococcus dokdonensis TaxID=443156 RepID=A0A1H0SPZ8_9MICO|nr:DUF6226 family protein [Pedococcus dokdonensis]SDP43276.1 hypothetical protein SAMN04489867_2440 [Pedococcus dokdonensis]
MDRTAVMAAVERAFEETSHGLAPWPDPRPDGRAPLEEEYSRLLDPAKYRLLGARFEAWARVLESEGWCRREPDADVEWVDLPGVAVTRTERLAPTRSGALDLAVVHSRIDTCDEAGLVLGVGTPAIHVGDFPGCGCDACDAGSEPLLEDLDETLWGLVSGAFVDVSDGERWARSFGDRGAASGLTAGDYEAWLADPGDRLVTRGAAWDAG